MKKAIAVLALQLGFAVFPAAAGIISFNFSGAIGYLDDANGYLNGLFTVGETYTGTLTYDVSSTVAYGDPTTYAIYAAGSDYNLTIDFGGNIFSDSNPSSIITQQGQYVNPYDSSAPVPGFVTNPGFGSTVMRLNLYGNYQDITDDGISDPSIFRLDSSPTDTSQSILAITYYDPSNQPLTTVIGSITSFESSSVPEPTTVLLTGLGIAALVGSRRFWLKMQR
jgi:hypothetical protein